MKLFIMRHAKSCSNMLRDQGLTLESKRLRDPDLSVIGRRDAVAAGPRIRRALSDAGFNIKGAVIGASTLRRAKETAGIVFGPCHPRTKGAGPCHSRLHLFPCFTENGKIPENTPQGRPYRAPDWHAFVEHLSSLDADNVAVVGHGSFIRNSVWPAITGAPRKERLNNLDGILIEYDAHFRVLSYTEILVDPDSCSTKTVGHGKMRTTRSRALSSSRSKSGSRKTRRRQRRRQSRQSGGGVNMPLAYFNNGAQMRGTFGESTGSSLSSPLSSTMIRAPLTRQ